jgi:hypothetical protein
LSGESPDCDEEGNDLGTVTKSVNYSVLYMKAVKALQEAMEQDRATLEAAAHCGWYRLAVEVPFNTVPSSRTLPPSLITS